MKWGEILVLGGVGVRASVGQFSEWAADQQRGHEGAVEPGAPSDNGPKAKKPVTGKDPPGLETSPGVGFGHASIGTGSPLYRVPKG